MNLFYKKIKGCDRYFPHTNVYLNDEYIGYIIRNNSFCANKLENWNFCSSNFLIPNFYESTQNKLKDKLSILCTKINQN